MPLPGVVVSFNARFIKDNFSLRVKLKCRLESMTPLALPAQYVDVSSQDEKGEEGKENPGRDAGKEQNIKNLNLI